MNITARAFAEMLIEQPPNDAADVFRNILAIYHDTLE